jgi:hypothetical protein
MESRAQGQKQQLFFFFVLLPSARDDKEGRKAVEEEMEQ